MILKFNRFDTEIIIDSNKVSTLEVWDRGLFSRMVTSLVSRKGEDSIEPYSLWDEDGKRLSTNKTLLLNTCLPDVPIADKTLLGKLYKKVCIDIKQDAELNESLVQAFSSIRETSSKVSFALWGTYDFEVDLDIAGIMKAFAFQPALDEDQSLFDKLIKFFELCVDIQFDIPLVFVNLKSFLSEDELQSLFEHAFFCRRSLLLLESWHSDFTHYRERKIRIDQQFIEF